MTMQGLRCFVSEIVDVEASHGSRFADALRNETSATRSLGLLLVLQKHEAKHVTPLRSRSPDVLIDIQRRPNFVRIPLACDLNTVRIPFIPHVGHLAFFPDPAIGFDGIAHLEPKLPSHATGIESLAEQKVVEVSADKDELTKARSKTK